MRKWLWGAFPVILCVGAGVWLYGRHLSEARAVARIIKVVGETAVAPRPVMPPIPAAIANPAGPELAAQAALSQAEAEVIEPIIVENRQEPERIVQPFRTGQIFVVGAEEASEPVVGAGQDTPPAYMPYADEETAEPPTGCDCPGWSWLCRAERTPCGCAGCGWVMELIKKIASIVCAPAPAQVIDAPATSDGEAQEPPPIRQDSFELPSMREDPNYHHHYPSCPYTGGCPYPYHQYRLPTQPINRVTPPAPQSSPESPKSPMSRLLPTADVPVVDTMECRPSDLPRPAGGNQPF